MECMNLGFFYRFIQLSAIVELPQLQQTLMNPADGNQSHVVLFTDGFIVQIQRPDGAGDVYFCGRHGKSCDSLNIQYITDKDDKTAALWSARLRQFLDNLPAMYVILGDAAHRGFHVITPFVGNNLTPEQQQYNQSCTRM